MVTFDGKTECGSEYSPLTENETKHKAIYMVYEGELEIGHGRIEKRDVFLCTNIKWLEGKVSVNFRKTNAL